jgi:hypothetical protein
VLKLHLQGHRLRRFCCHTATCLAKASVGASGGRSAALLRSRRRPAAATAATSAASSTGSPAAWPSRVAVELTCAAYVQQSCILTCQPARMLSNVLASLLLLLLLLKRLC